MKSITVENVEYDLTNISEEARQLLYNLQFVEEQILQRNNELQIALTAKMGYSRALKREAEKI